MSYSPELIALLGLDIPKSIPKKVGFLELSGQANKENTISKVYAYFLNLKANPDIAPIFIQALLNIIQEKTKKNPKALNFENFTCTTEVTTKKEGATKKGRIDILIKDDFYKSAIIIESKIYHHASNNPFNGYWRHVKYPLENKIGILLTLEEHEAPNSNFVNITHQDWVKAVQNIGIPSGLPMEKYVYLNDFFTTIDQLTKNYHMNDQTRFFFEHPQKVIQAKKTFEKAQQFINQQFMSISNFNGMRAWMHNAYNPRIYFDAEHLNNKYCEVKLDTLLKGEKDVLVKLKVQAHTLPIQKLIETVAPISEIPVLDNLKIVMQQPNNHSFTIATKTYTLTLEKDQENSVENLGEYLAKVVEHDFRPAITYLQNLLDK